MSEPTPVFDVHQHYGIVPGLAPADASPEDLLELDRQGRLAFMDQFGMRHAAIMPGHFYSAPRGLADIQAINDGVADYGRLAPDRFVALFGTVDPRHGRANLDEVDRLHALGFRGVSWHHRFQGLPMDHPVMMEIVGRMERLGLIAMTHCYAQGDFEAPWRLRRLAERFAGVTFVALDAMTSPESLEQLLAVMERCDNVYLDLTTPWMGGRGVRRAVERVGASRIVAGSNVYSMTAPDHVTALEAVDEARPDEAARRAILFDNACRLMGVPAVSR